MSELPTSLAGYLEDIKNHPMYDHPVTIGLFLGSLSLRLQHYRERFLAIRAQFNLGEETGLGMIPASHGPYTLGVLVALERKASGELFKLVPGLVTGSKKEKVSTEDWEDMAVRPNLNHLHPRLVSLYQNKGYGGYDPRFVILPDEIYDGVVAHELAHGLDIDDRIPISVHEELTIVRNTAPYRDLPRSFTHEVDMDLIASFMGFRQSVIAKHEYYQQCLATYDKPSYTYPTSPDEIIAASRLRLKIVQSIS